LAEQKMRQHIRNARAFVEEQIKAADAVGRTKAPVPAVKGKATKARVQALKVAEA
jgi:hypothetical protein